MLSLVYEVSKDKVRWNEWRRYHLLQILLYFSRLLYMSVNVPRATWNRHPKRVSKKQQQLHERIIAESQFGFVINYQSEYEPSDNLISENNYDDANCLIPSFGTLDDLLSVDDPMDDVSIDSDENEEMGHPEFEYNMFDNDVHNTSQFFVSQDWSPSDAHSGNRSMSDLVIDTETDPLGIFIDQNVLNLDRDIMDDTSEEDPSDTYRYSQFE